jgi:hypothetical protein
MAEMNGKEAPPPKYTRGDLLTAMFLAALIGAWILAFAGILLLHGVGGE